MVEDGDFVEAPIGRWQWATVPLAGLALGNQVANSVGEFCGNLAFALGMHLKWKAARDDEREVSSSGPVIRED